MPITAPPPSVVEPRDPPAVASSSWPWSVAGGVTGGLGLVGFAVAAGFAADARGAWSDAACTDGRCPDAAAQAQAERAGRSADRATAFAVGGGALAAAGAVLLVVGLWPADGGDGDDVVGVTPNGVRLRF